LIREEPDIEAPIPATAYRAATVISRFFHSKIFGAENVPDGPVLVVGNHALMGIDSFALMPELHKATGRFPRALGLRSLFDTPILGPILRECGAVPGTRDCACDLLASGEMVVVYPGGARDSMKGRGEQYRLRWGSRRGFAHVAIRAGAPVVPIAAIGPDDVFPVLTRRGILGMDWLGNDRVPLFLPLARRVPFRFWVGEPIRPPARDPDDPDDQARAFANRVKVELTHLIDHGLEERAFE
jgi:1-acyl-sn-glycerol-3-phosphate acyltransferase